MGGELLVCLQACFQPGRQRRYRIKCCGSADGGAQAAGRAGAAFVCAMVMGVVRGRITARCVGSIGDMVLACGNLFMMVNLLSLRQMRIVLA
ncbi:MAG: hypothetical protein JWQ61_3791 [Collimonas fungivorans]|nr:hypothetical protein [Collimonas fungivorans]